MVHVILLKSLGSVLSSPAGSGTELRSKTISVDITAVSKRLVIKNYEKPG